MNRQEFLNYIDGEFAPGLGKVFFQKMNPFTGEVLGEVAVSEALDVIRAIQGAKTAQAEYEKWSLEQRAELLDRIADKLEAKIEEFSFLEALHQGLLQSFVQEKSLRYAIQCFRSTAEEVRLQSIRQKENPSLLVHPTGLVSLILSWNLSLRLLAERLAPALAAGNVCLVKVSELSPVTVQIMGEVLTEVQAPKGLVQLIQGRGPEVGALLAAHPAVRAVNFVGQLSTSEKVISSAVSQSKKLQVQAGTKNNIFVLNEVDFQNKVPEILQSFLQGQGQLCWNSSRIFVLESFQKEFIEKLKEYFATLRPATSPRDSSPWTPLISEAVLQKTEERSQKIQQEGGKLISGGGRWTSEKGFFFEPTVSLDLPNCSEMQQDEIRGPILILTAVKYQHEMLKWANTSYYAHSAIVWAPSAEKALKVAEKVEAANVSVNSWFSGKLQPGYRQSSFGNLEGEAWGRFYSDVKVLTGL